MSTRGRYAIRILLSIARHYHEGAVSKRLISNEETISSDYIEQIIVPLKNAGLVVGLRGIKGGFCLARDPAKITLYDIVRIAEGEITLVDCDKNDCKGRDKTLCCARVFWDEAARRLIDYLSTITLENLLEKEKEMGCFKDKEIV